MSAILDRGLDPERLAQCRAADAAMSAAQRGWDNRTDDRLDAMYAGEERRLIAEGAARAEAEHAMEQALTAAVPAVALRSNEGWHSPATLVSTLLGADDAEVNTLTLAALRAACAVDRGRPRRMCDEEAGAALRKLGEVLCARFGAEHFAAYVGVAA